MTRDIGKESLVYVTRVLLYLYDRERTGKLYPSLSEIIEKTGVPRAVFYNHLKDNLEKARYVEYEKTPDRVILAKLTSQGRRLAQCLDKCRDILP